MFKSKEAKIAEIHLAFDSAQDRLLAEAKAILAQSGPSVEALLINQATRLSNLGFTNAKLVKEVEKKKVAADTSAKTKELTKAEAELIEYYKVTYPFIKFLTEAELDRICDKYNLVYAPVANYLGNVPEKNLRDIETAQPLHRNELKPAPSDQPFAIIRHNDDSALDRVIVYNMKGISGSSKIGKCLRSEVGLQVNLRANDANSRSHLTKYLESRYPELKGHLDRWFTAEMRSEKRTGLFIAAPRSEFDLTGLKKNKKGFFAFTEFKVEDPIVFRYCRGGIQVLTKWGIEANDPALLLPINN